MAIGFVLYTRPIPYRPLSPQWDRIQSGISPSTRYLKIDRFTTRMAVDRNRVVNGNPGLVKPIANKISFGKTTLASMSSSREANAMNLHQGDCVFGPNRRAY